VVFTAQLPSPVFSTPFSHLPLFRAATICVVLLLCLPLCAAGPTTWAAAAAGLAADVFDAVAPAIFMFGMHAAAKRKYSEIDDSNSSGGQQRSYREQPGYSDVSDDAWWSPGLDPDAKSVPVKEDHSRKQDASILQVWQKYSNHQLKSHRVNGHSITDAIVTKQQDSHSHDDKCHCISFKAMNTHHARQVRSAQQGGIHQHCRDMVRLGDYSCLVLTKSERLATDKWSTAKEFEDGISCDPNTADKGKPIQLFLVKPQWVIDTITTETLTLNQLRAAAVQVSSIDPLELAAMVEQPDLLPEVLQINGANAPQLFVKVMDSLLEAALTSDSTKNLATAKFSVRWAHCGFAVGQHVSSCWHACVEMFVRCVCRGISYAVISSELCWFAMGRQASA
jgi:hypothetical protein